MRLFTRNRAALLAIGATLVMGSGLIGPGVSADGGSALDKANGHPALDSGKAVSHFSGALEVTFDERAEAADVQSSIGSDTPPDASASALGCANRGSLTNPRLNQDCTLRRQAEEQVTVNPTDPTNVIAGQNDSRVGFNHCGFDYSLDGGKTWGDDQPPFFQHLSQLGHTYDAASDPALTFNGAGTAWFSCVLFDVNTNASALPVVPSTATLKGSAYANIGAGPSPFIVAEASDGSHFFDKEFIAGDKRAGHTEVYVTWTDFQARANCKRQHNTGGFCQSPIFISQWTGTSWTAPLEISGHSPLCTTGNTFNVQIPADACNFDQGSMPVVLPNGDVYVVFNNFNTPTLVDQQLGVHVHVNGTTLTPDAPVKVGVDDETLAGLCNFGRGPEQCVESLNIRSQDFPAIALDPTNASHLVATWTDTRKATVKGNYDVVVSESNDGGATWSDAKGAGSVLITTGAYFEPSVAVAANGHIAVSLYHANTAQHTAVVGDGTFGYGYHVNTGSGFGPYLPASDGQAYQSPQANSAQRGFLGDYSSIAAAPTGNTVYMVWADTRNTSASGIPDEDVFIFKATI